MELKYGTVTDTKPGFVKVNFESFGLVSKWLPVTLLQTYETKRVLTIAVNTFVACLMDGNAENGICLGGIYNQAQPTPEEITEGVVYADGTVIDYNPETKELKIEGVKEISINLSGKVNITCTEAKITAQSTEITAAVNKINGALTVTGPLACGSLGPATPGAPLTLEADLNIAGTLETTGDITAGTVSLLQHIHTGVTTGGGVSGPPKP